MSSAALVMMVAVCGFVWGGFSVLITRAVRAEGRKLGGRAEERPPARSR